jgi:polysaccharide export outer membrane protein
MSGTYQALGNKLIRLGSPLRQFLKGWMILQLGCCLPLVAHTETQEQTKQGKATTQSAAASDGNGNTQTQERENQTGQDFVIGPGDVLNILVWKEPDFTKTVPVRPDGKISLPLVDDVAVSGLTTTQLKDVITEKLKKYVAEPTVTITVEKVESQKVIVLGEVSGVGPQPLTGPTRIMDVLATVAFTSFAKKTKIYVLRTENGKPTRFNFNYKDYIKGKNPEQNILLKNGDTIIVP